MHLSGEVFVGVITADVQKKSCLEKSLSPTPLLALSCKLTQMEDEDGAPVVRDRWVETKAAPPAAVFLLSDALGITPVILSPQEPWLSPSIQVTCGRGCFPKDLLTDDRVLIPAWFML